MKKRFVGVLMAAIFMFSFSSAALAHEAPAVHKTYYFSYYKDYADYRDYKHHQYVDYKMFKEYMKDQGIHHFDYKDFLKWLEQFKEKNHSFGVVHLQGYQNGVAQYK